MADILPPVDEDDRMLSGLAYPLWPLICPIILYGSKKTEPFVHFHAMQGLAVGVCSFAATVVLGLITWICMFVLSLDFLAGTVGGFLGLATFFISGFLLLFYLTVILYLAWRAVCGSFFRLPFIGKWAESKMQLALGIAQEDYATDILGERREVKLSAFDYEKLLPPEPEPVPDNVDENGFAYEYYEDEAGGVEQNEAEPYYDENTGEMVYGGGSNAGTVEYYKNAADSNFDYDILASADKGLNSIVSTPTIGNDIGNAKQSSGFKATVGSGVPRTNANSAAGNDGFKPLATSIGRPYEARQAPAPVVIPTDAAPEAVEEFKPGLVGGKRPNARFQWSSLEHGSNQPEEPKTTPKQRMPRLPGAPQQDGDGFKAW